MISYNDWMSGTRWPLKRTDELKALDTALQNYCKNPMDLTPLMHALNNWARKKGLFPNGKIKTERNEQVVTRLVNDVLQANTGTFGIWLRQDRETARKLCDPYLTQRVIGQGLGDSAEDREKYRAGAGASAGALFAELQKLRSGEKSGSGIDKASSIKPSAAKQASPYTSQDFWLRKGEAESNAAPNGGLWCDASAALAVHLLARNQNFKSSLHVASQGDPTKFGHWYVVANRSDNELLEFEHFFGPQDGHYNFTIDIWGAIRGQRRSSVIYPGQAIYDCDHHTGAAYDNNTIEVRCKFAAKAV